MNADMKPSLRAPMRLECSGTVPPRVIGHVSPAIFGGHYRRPVSEH